MSASERSTDFMAMRVLMSTHGWYEQNAVREILAVDGGAVRIFVEADFYRIESRDPFIDSPSTFEVKVSRRASYGAVRMIAEQIRLVVSIGGPGVRI